MALDLAEFRGLYEESFDTVYRYACALTGDLSLAEDVAADTFMRAWRSRDNYRAEGPVLSWLLSITHNTARTAIRPNRAKLAAVRKLGVSEQTSYRWRREDGGQRVDQATRLGELVRENSRLKRLVADQALDNAMLRDIAEGNFFAQPGGPGRRPTSATSTPSRSGGPAGLPAGHGARNGTCRGRPAMNQRWSRGSWRW